MCLWKTRLEREIACSADFFQSQVPRTKRYNSISWHPFVGSPHRRSHFRSPLGPVGLISIRANKVGMGRGRDSADGRTDGRTRTAAFAPIRGRTDADGRSNEEVENYLGNGMSLCRSLRTPHRPQPRGRASPPHVALTLGPSILPSLFPLACLACLPLSPYQELRKKEGNVRALARGNGDD